MFRFKTTSVTACAALLLALLAGFAHAAPGDLTPTDIPDDLVALDEEVTLTWLEPVEAILQVGPSVVEWTIDVTADASVPGSLTFTPQAGGVGAGVWAARLLVPGTNQSSLPFYLLVEAENAPLMTSPQNGTEIEGGTTLLSWEAVLGVPYYHVVFSDQEIVIGEDENGDATISGANIIWQVIVPTTSVEYGADDPSGFFDDMNGTTPPLVPGSEYNWLVLNNYGNNPALTSTQQSGVSAFTVADNSAMLPPDLLTPAPLDSLADETITFEWSEVEGAAHYHFYLSRIVDSDESQGSVAVYDQLTGQTLLDLPASSMLVEARHLWKVFALDETGQGVASELREFHYEIGMGTLDIRTRDEASDIVPFVDVALTPLAGGGSAIPIMTGSGGGYDEEYLPGTYRLTTTKQGYETATADVEVTIGETTAVTLILPENPARISGMVRLDDTTPVPFALVTAVNTVTSEVRQVSAGSGGDFQLGVDSGFWRLTAGKSGYHAGDPVAVEIVPGEYHELAAALPLIPNSSTISGAVVSDSGQPMISATVKAVAGAEVFTRLTGTDGLFQFSLDAGDWTITASKSGYVSSAPREKNLDPGEDLTLDPPLTLSAQAAIVSGFVTTGSNILAGATVTATPATGAATSLTSGPNGNFQFSLSPGTWVLSASYTGYTADGATQLTLVPGDSQAGVELAMIANPCSVSGNVNDGAAGLGSATISNGSVEVQSDWRGDFTIALPAGAQSLGAWKSGYGTGEPLPLDLTPGQTLTGVEFLLSPNAATVNGRVLNDDVPVAGAKVLLASPADTLIRNCDQLGYFTVSSAPGDYDLWAAKEGMVPDAPLELTLGPGQTLNGQELDLQPATATLSGEVTADGSPLREVQIVAVGAAGSAGTTTNLNGRWTLVVPAGGAWTVSAAKPGFGADQATSPVLDNGDAWTHDFELVAQPALLSGYLEDDEGYPLAGVTVSVSGASAASTQSAVDGYYHFSLQPGACTLSVTKAGYAPFAESITLAVGTQTRDIVLTSLFASLAGTVRDGDGAVISGVSLSAVGPTGSGSAGTDADGAYRFPRLLDGAYTVTVSRQGYSPATSVVDLEENEDAQRDFVLIAHDGTLSGTVVDELTAPLANVSLQVFDGTTLIAQGLTDALGVFAIVSLPTDRPLSLSASLGGYSAVSANPLTGLTAPAADLDFTLAANTGVIRGIVRDAATLLPIDDADVNVSDGAGYFGTAESDSSGAFRIEDLRAASVYSALVDAAGWSSATRSGLVPDAALITIDLEAAPASVHGLIALDREVEGFELPAGSKLLAIPLEGSSREAEIALTNLGDYDLGDLFPGTYSLKLRIDGYVTEPRSRTIEVTENSVTGPYDFTLIAAPLLSVQVNGEEELDNDGSYLFRGALTSQGGEQVDYPVAWSCVPEDAGALDAETGRFTPRSDYIGEVRLQATHAASGISGDKTVKVFARIDPLREYELDNGAGLRFSLPRGAVTQAVRVGVTRKTPSTIKRRAGSYRVEGSIYHFLPDGLAFTAENSPTLVLPIPNAVYNSALAVGWWDPDALAWSALPGVKWTDGLARDLEHFSDFALLAANASLGVQSARLAPNPFSPEAAEGGANIVYVLSSTDMAAPIVDIEIYNMIGDPVRTLVEHESRVVGETHSEFWDGTTDEGKLARNGRYIVRIQVEDSSGTEEKILQAVLIK